MKEFDSVLASAQWTVVVDFYATWCGPCKMLAPVIDALAEKYSDVTFLKVDIDEVSDLAETYWITSIPTVWIGNNHEITDAFVWVHPQDFYEEKISQFLTVSK